MIALTCSLIGLVVVSAYLYSRYRHRFWSSRGIQTVPYIAFLGHLHKILSPGFPFWIKDEVYKCSRSGICGLYEVFKPILVVGEPELIKSVMIKDFDHFTDRRSMEFSHERDVVLNDMLVSINGEQWKNLRAILTPTFTSGKLRNMFDSVAEKSDVLVSYCLQEATEDRSVEMRDVFSRFILDTISTCAFGFESNCINDKDSIFAKRAALFSDFGGIGSTLKLLLLMISPTLFSALNLSLYPPGILFFNDVVNKAIAARKKGEKRGDFLDLLLEAQSTETSSNKSSKMVLDDKMILSQSIMFLMAGSDTTTTVLTFASYLIAKHPEEQKRLRQELQEVIESHGGFNYEAIMNAKFLDACLMESMRRYPVAPVLERVCSKPYLVPGTNVTMSPGYIVHVPVWGIHMDEQYWPEPEAFKPDRFMPENKENITNYTFMPFGIGPRNCIAMRFAIMESKIALAKLVLSANLEVVPGFEELKLSSVGGILKSEDGVHLFVTPIIEE